MTTTKQPVDRRQFQQPSSRRHGAERCFQCGAAGHFTRNCSSHPEEPYFTAPTESVKLAPLLLSQVAGGNSPGSSCTRQLPGIVLERAIGSCPVTTVNLGGYKYAVSLTPDHKSRPSPKVSLTSTSALEGATCWTQANGLLSLLPMAWKYRTSVTWNLTLKHWEWLFPRDITVVRYPPDLQ